VLVLPSVEEASESALLSGVGVGDDPLLTFRLIEVVATNALLLFVPIDRDSMQTVGNAGRVPGHRGKAAMMRPSRRQRRN